MAQEIGGARHRGPVGEALSPRHLGKIGHRAPAGALVIGMELERRATHQERGRPVQPLPPPYRRVQRESDNSAPALAQVADTLDDVRAGRSVRPSRLEMPGIAIDVIHETAPDLACAVPEASPARLVGQKKQSRIFDTASGENHVGSPAPHATPATQRHTHGLHARTTRIRLDLENIGIERDADIRRGLEFRPVRRADVTPTGPMREPAGTAAQPLDNRAVRPSQVGDGQRPAHCAPDPP